ncbi:FAD-dependent oxidoreductase [Actinoplanes sp. NPDC051343]|uniref:oxidoreductase n=1 Tax=Actinoplanes sp. NPDC051343 TaxID=3363906 RepID=UPI0037A8AFCD
MTLPLLGSPLQVGPLRLRNRVVAAPMERNYADREGRSTARYEAYLRARAAGGTALVFTEATFVRPDGRGRIRQLGAHDDRVVPGLRALSDAVHAEGAWLGVELNHAGRVADPVVSGFQPVAPSPVPFRGHTPRELTTGEAEMIVTAFGAAAARCAEAGVDVLSVHGAHGYLIHQFLSPRTNHRTDRYADPVVFLNEVLAAVRSAAPALFLRLSAFEGVPGGLDRTATLALARRLRLELVDVIDVSAGCYEAGEWMVQPGEVPRGVLASAASAFRALGKPVCVAGRIPTGDAAEDVLRSGAADLVAVGRALHADPGWTATVLRGAEPRPCIGCNQGCIDELHTQRPIWCVVNPSTGHEWQPPVPPSGGVGRVVVVGAGPAGLEAARRAATAGHRVTLFEAQSRIGGQFRLASELPSRPEFGRLLTWYDAALKRLGVDLRLSTAASPASVAALAPDLVVVAAGGVSLIPPVPGADRARVTGLLEWLATSPPVDRADVVTVWGADRAGIAAADAIAAAGQRVLLIGAGEEPAPEAGFREKVLVVRRLAGNPDVEIRLGATVESIEDEGLLLGRDGRLEPVPVRGPVLVSQGTVPRPVDLGPGDWRAVVLDETPSAAEAIRLAAAIRL